MIEYEQGQSQGIRGIQETDKFNPDSHGYWTFGQDGEADGYQPQRISREVCQGNSRSEDDPGCPHGGILSRLDRVEHQYLNYIKAHKERLETRLAEDEEQERQAISELKELRADIVKLLLSKEGEP